MSMTLKDLLRNFVNNPVALEILNSFPKVKDYIDKPKVKDYIDKGDFKVIYELFKKIPELKELQNQVNLRKDFNNWFIYGVRTIMDKTAFVDDQETSYLNYDSILAEKVS